MSVSISSSLRSDMIETMVKHDNDGGGLYFSEFNDKWNDYADSRGKITSGNDATKLAHDLGLHGKEREKFVELVTSGLSAKEVFNKFDMNGSGRISKTDLKISGTGNDDHPIDDDNGHGNVHDNPITNGQLTEFGYKDIPNGEGARINYIKAANYHNSNFKIDPKADYMLIVNSGGGHGSGAHKPIDPDHMNVPEHLQSRVVGWVGSRDKCMLLLDVRGLKTMDFQGQNETEIAWIDVPSGKTLSVDNKCKNGEINGALDPALGKKDVQASSSSDFAIYAEDEGKFPERKEHFRKSASLYFDGGDNSLMLFKRGKGMNLHGNGAIAQISIR